MNVIKDQFEKVRQLFLSKAPEKPENRKRRLERNETEEIDLTQGTPKKRKRSELNQVQVEPRQRSPIQYLRLDQIGEWFVRTGHIINSSPIVTNIREHTSPRRLRERFERFIRTEPEEDDIVLQYNSDSFAAPMSRGLHTDRVYLHSGTTGTSVDKTPVKRQLQKKTDDTMLGRGNVKDKTADDIEIVAISNPPDKTNQDTNTFKLPVTNNITHRLKPGESRPTPDFIFTATSNTSANNPGVNISYKQNTSRYSPAIPKSRSVFRKKMGGCLSRGQKGSTVRNCINLDERNRYQDLLSQFSTAPTPCTTFGSGPIKTQRPLFNGNTANTSILGSHIPPVEMPKGKAFQKDIITPNKQTVQINKHYPQKGPALGPLPGNIQAQRAKAKSPISQRDNFVNNVERTQRADQDGVINRRLGKRASPDEQMFSSRVEKSGKKESEKSEEIVVIDDDESPPLAEELKKSVSGEFINSITSKYDNTHRLRQKQIEEETSKCSVYAEKRELWETDLTKRIKERIYISEQEPAVEEEIFIESEDEAEELPELTDEIQARINNALSSRNPNEVLVDAFRLEVTRRDIATLTGLNWLNDQVINFYMELLMARGKQDNRPSVHAFNTFFYPKLMSQGHSGLRRWTRKIDLFSMDYIVVPVHLGMHWCLAIVDFPKKQLRYFDSMGGKNIQCLEAIKSYLLAESLDKKKQTFDMSEWTMVIEKDIPQQQNGSDCGMFACKFSEYITRNAPISFTQEDMPYFRQRMIYEIITAQLM
ncbi:unnamed protein product [Owenia fusiformis]|uniref:Uncharacterized protein n=1 Tax=Owenia fusiformis TaxID=6347 RepID=A0A8J1TR41_OWEFU|nr:unnamed protein product [Owenia fusiformis]